MKRVFVSYSRSDLDVVAQLVQDLQAVGIDAWHDHSLTGGQRWWETILGQIRECDVFIFALSPESWDSEACRSELGYVQQLGKTILPVLVSDGINTKLLPSPFSEIQVTDYRRADKDAAFALVKSINTAASAMVLPDPLPPPPAIPVSYLNGVKERISSKETLNSQEQITLLFQLDSGLRDGRSRTEIRDLLLRLKRRDDLLAKVAREIDVTLQRMDAGAPPPSDGNPFDSRLSAGFQDRDVGETRDASVMQRCPQCHRQFDSGSKFCGACGTVLVVPSDATGPSLMPALSLTQPAPMTARSKSRRYMSAPGDTARLMNDLKGWLDAQKFDCQQMTAEDRSVVLQIKRRGGWRDFVGMSTALNVAFHQSGGTLTVEIGAGKWVDKAAVGVVSMVILWPLAVTAGFGAWQQMKMPERIFDFLGTRAIH